jgi:hypothetical protein
VTLTPSLPCRIVRWGIINHLDAWVFGSAVIQLLQTTHAANGGITEAAAGTTTMTEQDLTEGEVLYVTPSSEVIVKPGDAIDVDMTTGGTSGDIIGFIQYQQLNWDDSGNNATFNDSTRTFGKIIDGTS